MTQFGIISDELAAKQHVYFPHFMAGEVPTDPGANKAWRDKWWFTDSKADQAAFREMCRRDFLFWLTGFVNIFDAGHESMKPGPVPFIPYPFQVECLTAMWDALHVSGKSFRVKKPRKVGATWMVVALAKHLWRFFPDRQILVGSRSEDEVEGSMVSAKSGRFFGEWSKLLPKFDYIDIFQPTWMWPEGYTPRMEPFRTRMKIINPENRSLVTGTSATSKAGRQDRGAFAFWDEAAHTENLYGIIGGLSEYSPTKAWVSSIDDLSHPFSTTLRNSPEIVQIEPDLFMHPVFAAGMTIDPETGTRSSPWLRRKLDAIGNDPLIANREYFADESKQVGGFYSEESYRKMTGTSDCPGTVCDPFSVGELDIVDSNDGPRVHRWCEQGNGRSMLWMHLDVSGRPSRSTRYIVAVDVAAGSKQGGRGASNTVVAVTDWFTGALVFQFVTHGMKPYELAKVVCAVQRWFEGDDFRPARTIVERNGPGAECCETLRDVYDCDNLYMEKSSSSAEFLVGYHKGSGETARLAFGMHEMMLCDGRFKERDLECVKEMQCYQRNPNGTGPPVHTASLRSEDPTGARDNHGDRVITRILTCNELKNPYSAEPKGGQAVPRSYRAMQESEKRGEYVEELV